MALRQEQLGDEEDAEGPPEELSEREKVRQGVVVPFESLKKAAKEEEQGKPKEIPSPKLGKKEGREKEPEREYAEAANGMRRAFYALRKTYDRFVVMGREGLMDGNEELDKYRIQIKVVEGLIDLIDQNEAKPDISLVREARRQIQNCFGFLNKALELKVGSLLEKANALANEGYLTSEGYLTPHISELLKGAETAATKFASDHQARNLWDAWELARNAIIFMERNIPEGLKREEFRKREILDRELKQIEAEGKRKEKAKQRREGLDQRARAALSQIGMPPQNSAAPLPLEEQKIADAMRRELRPQRQEKDEKLEGESKPHKRHKGKKRSSSN